MEADDPMPAPDAEFERRILGLSNEDLAKMVFVESDQYREEALEIARAEARRRELTSAASAPPIAAASARSAPTLLKLIPTDRLARLWPGFAITAFLFVVEVCLGVLGPKARGWRFSLPVLSLSAYFYWIFCVHRIHALLAEATGGSYPIPPNKAAGYHFMPLYNFYWYFVWPRRLASFLERQPAGGSMLGTVSGFAFLLAFFASRFVDVSIGLALLFGTMAYIHSRIRRSSVKASGRGSESIDWSSRAQM